VDLSGRACNPVVAGSAEVCDALDNDCDGEVDEGDGLCDAFQVCDRGHCVDQCSEFGCRAGEICTEQGLCVDAECVDVACGPGQRCFNGECVGACDWVTCPHGQGCVGGRCVDLCAAMTCDECTVCVDGSCEMRCAWAPCAEGQTCGEDGRCVDSSCVGVDCGPGTYCSGGTCLDACEGSACPFGEVCEAGACVPGPDVEPDGGPGDADAPPSDGDLDADADVAPDADPGGDADSEAGADSGGPGSCRGIGCTRPGSCNCTAPAPRVRDRATPLWLALAGLGLLAVRRRP
jgi:hypothetical protein